MNRERLGGRPEGDPGNSLPSSGADRDQVGYRGPLKDPTKRPIEESVRPPPDLDFQADPGGFWAIHEEEFTPEQVRTLGRFLYVTMFANWNPAVIEVLLAEQGPSTAAIDAEPDADSLPVFRPAAAFVDAFAARYHMSAPFLHRVCDAASREIGQEMRPLLRSGLDEYLRDPKLKVNEALDVMAGRRPWRQRYEESLVAIQRVAEHGLQASYSEHLDLIVAADDHGADLGVPFQRIRLRP